MSLTPHLAVVGGGQLARMMQVPAVALGLRIRLLAEGPDVSAAQVVPDHLVGDHTDLDDLRAVCAEHADDLAAIMVTYPSTHGVYEDGITELCDVVHAAGGQVYVDGANLNALLGQP